ncbi:DUF771 domain-containing protein [Jeotgalibaca sp. A127]|uniref:DUF771 domain-containing protein n=1 Tax=Jeotgalibaca sp. A127 TaxID=3457324 RepID=UPI003FD045A9
MSEWVGIDYLKDKTGYRSATTLKKRVLLPYRVELEEFTYYPKKGGERWKFNRYWLDKWLRENIC